MLIGVVYTIPAGKLVTVMSDIGIVTGAVPANDLLPAELIISLFNCVVITA